MTASSAARRRRISPSPKRGYGAAAGGGDVEHGLDDPLVARAPAQVPGQRLAHLALGRVGAIPQERLGGEQEAGRAEPALQRVALVEGLLQRVQLVAVGEPLDGQQRAAVRLRGEHEARAHGLAVELDRARAAHAVLAADVRAGQPGLVADEVRQQRARLDLPGVRPAVDLHLDPHDASSIARRTSSAVSARR
jgi:hypothetical protein